VILSLRIDEHRHAGPFRPRRHDFGSAHLPDVSDAWGRGVHKIARVLDALPKRLQPDAKKRLHEIMEAPHAQGRQGGAGALPRAA
jgi:hypothetical protein